jgi:hypothetical protein
VFVCSPHPPPPHPHPPPPPIAPHTYSNNILFSFDYNFNFKLTFIYIECSDDILSICSSVSFISCFSVVCPLSGHVSSVVFGKQCFHFCQHFDQQFSPTWIFRIYQW